MRRKKIRTEVSVKGDNLYLIVTDPQAGHPGRYTVHKVSLAGMNETEVIGRELPLRFSRRVVRSHKKHGKWINK